MYLEQGMVCEICKKPKELKELKVDHCHKSRKIRGLLCHKCNVLLGMCLDNKKILRNAIIYLNGKMDESIIKIENENIKE
jgi:hypothetical protein